MLPPLMRKKNNRAQAARRYGGREKSKLERMMLLTGVVCFAFYKSRKPLSLYIHLITTMMKKQHHHPFFSHTPTTLIPILLFLATLTPFSLYYKCKCARKATSFSPWKSTPCFPLEENEMTPLKLIKHIIGRRVYHQHFH